MEVQEKGGQMHRGVCNKKSLSEIKVIARETESWETWVEEQINKKNKSLEIIFINYFQNPNKVCRTILESTFAEITNEQSK